MKRLSQLVVFFFFIGLTPCFTQSIYADLTPAGLFNGRGEIYFKFRNIALNINELSRIISIDKVSNEEIYAYANIKEFTSFLKLNLDFELLPKPGEAVKDPKMLSSVDIRAISDWDFYPTYDAYVDMMYQYAQDYPDLCDVFSIGSTVEGREILVAKISDNVGVRETEPQFLYTGCIHGDEILGYILLLRLIDYLLSNYGTIDQVTDIVNNIEVWINPLSNPDGTYAGGNNSVYGATRYNANYVDMNRNYPDAEEGPHPDGEEWQPETVHFMQLAGENNFVMSANTHGGAEVINYPWDTWPRLAADDSWWVFVSREYADTVHQYAPPSYLRDLDNGITNGYAWYTISGGRQDYMNYFHNCREVTMELSNTKLLPANQLPAYWGYNYRSMLNYLEQCKYGVNGIVSDVNSGEPLVGKVFIEGHDLDNSFVFADNENGFYQRLLDQGTYDITFSAPGHYPVVIQDVYVSRYNTVILDVQLDAGSLAADFSASATAISIGGSVDFQDASFGNPVSWTWTFEGGMPSSSSVQNPSDITYPAAGSFDVTLIVTNASGDSQSITKENYITVNAEYLMGNQTVNTCTGLFYDSGGETSNYNDDEDFIMTFMPGTGGGEVIAEFMLFDVEYQSSCNYDWLKIYNGTSVSAPLMGTWCGTDSPGTIQASGLTGALTFRFHSDYSETKQGWKALISCSSPPLLPVADFVADTTHIREGESIHFTDLTSNNPTSWQWTFEGGTPLVSSEQNPIITYFEPGIYDVTLVVQNQYGTDTKLIQDYITVDSTIGIGELLMNGVMIYPNPLTGNELTVRSQNVVEQIQLFDHTGRLVIKEYPRSDDFKIYTGHCRRGIYLVKLFSGNAWSSHKISIIN